MRCKYKKPCVSDSHSYLLNWLEMTINKKLARLKILPHNHEFDGFLRDSDSAELKSVAYRKGVWC